MRQALWPGALGRPRGIGWRGRWEGGSGWGLHVTPWLIHVNVWQSPLQCCEVISLHLIKINEKKKKRKLKKRKKNILKLKRLKDTKPHGSGLHDLWSPSWKFLLLYIVFFFPETSTYCYVSYFYYLINNLLKIIYWNLLKIKAIE